MRWRKLAKANAQCACHVERGKESRTDRQRETEIQRYTKRQRETEGEEGKLGRVVTKVSHALLFLQEMMQMACTAPAPGPSHHSHTPLTQDTSVNHPARGRIGWADSQNWRAPWRQGRWNGALGQHLRISIGFWCTQSRLAEREICY